MAGIGLIVAAILAVVGFYLWNLENFSAVFREKGRIVKKWIAPGYNPFIYSPLLHPRTSFWSSQLSEGKERFFLRIKLKELGAINIKVDRQAFEEAKEGESVVLLCQKGGITGRTKILDLYLRRGGD